MKLGLIGLLFLSVHAGAAIEAFQLPNNPNNVGTYLSFVTGAQNAAREVWKGLNGCGLEVMNAYDPRLPRPQIIALSAIVARHPNGIQVLAYYNEEDGANSLVWQAPNGGYVHRISYSDRRIEFVVPYQGQVAWANRYFNPAGIQYNFWLRGVSTPVPYDYWHQGVQSNFINLLVGQLCRYSPGTSAPSSTVPNL